MKTIITGALTIIAYLGMVCCGIWAIVSFLIYLVKDIPFNWNSVWSLIGFLVLLIFCGFGYLFFSANPKELRFPKTSKYQDRLNELAEKRKQNSTLNN